MNTVTTRIRTSSSPQSKLPSVCWNERTNAWHGRIGYVMASSGKRIRGEQRYKFPNTQVGEHLAVQAAIKIRGQWEATLQIWPRWQENFEKMARQSRSRLSSSPAAASTGERPSNS